MEAMQIRSSTDKDRKSILALYPEVFPQEDLLPLVGDLLSSGPDVLSLVAILDSEMAGHVIWTRCGLNGQDTRLALLGPLAVAPKFQRQGMGTALVRTGLNRMQQESIRRVLVLGDPAYYSRFGFRSEPDIQAPYPLPAAWSEAWQSLNLDQVPIKASGKLRVPPPWMNADLWSP